MGGGYWDSDGYKTATTTRAKTGVDDFDYSKKNSSIHENLDPKRINGKPFGKLESRDSVDHPLSNAIFLGLDVTGSNIDNAKQAQKALGLLMDMLPKYISDPQVAIAANDDYFASGLNAIQIADFESDNRVDEHLRNLLLVGNGGGNHQESYDLLLYAAARKTILDCFEQRGHKGYLILYADEPIPKTIAPKTVLDIFGDSISESISIATIIEEARRLYDVFILWPANGYQDARDQYVKLLGNEFVITLKDPTKICEAICGIVGINESAVTIDEAERDLISAGVDKKTASGISQALIPLSQIKSVARPISGLPGVGGGKKGGAKRL